MVTKSNRCSPAFANATVAVHAQDAIANSGATQIFIMEGIPMLNR